MTTVKIDHTSGVAPHDLVEAMVAGQTYPFLATLKHNHSKPLVVPSSGTVDVIAPGAKTKVRIKNLEQAWMLVTDLSELAVRAGNKAQDFAEIEPADVEPTVNTERPAATDASQGAASDGKEAPATAEPPRVAKTPKSTAGNEQEVAK